MGFSNTQLQNAYPDIFPFHVPSLLKLIRHTLPECLLGKHYKNTAEVLFKNLHSPWGDRHGLFAVQVTD